MYCQYYYEYHSVTTELQYSMNRQYKRCSTIDLTGGNVTMIIYDLQTSNTMKSPKAPSSL